MSLKIDNLKKVYVSPDGGAVPVIDIAAMAAADGEQIALVGSSGSGKTTLLHLIAGILKADSGSITHDYRGNGKAVDTRPADSKAVEYQGFAPGFVFELTRLSESERDAFRGRYIGYIFQSHHLLGGFTALENVMLGMSFTGRPADEKWARHLLTEVGLSDRLNYRPGKLSIGQQQRVAVARALANRPKLVLADEPTGSLDKANAQQVLDLIRKLCTEVGATLLLVSHDEQITRQFPRVLQLSEINRAAI